MTEAEKIVTKVSRDLQQLIQLVKGNGTKKGSIVGMIDDLDARITVVENYPCRDGCLFEKYEEREEEMNTRKRSFRIGDLANLIQLALLAIVIYQLFGG